MKQTVLAPISIGELYDKITILQVKLHFFEDEEAMKYLWDEFQQLQKLAVFNIPQILVSQLFNINFSLWEVEDKLRILESKEDFGREFVELARKVYMLNDARAAAKKSINLEYGSEIIEQKQYAAY